MLTTYAPATQILMDGRVTPPSMRKIRITAANTITRINEEKTVSRPSWTALIVIFFACCPMGYGAKTSSVRTSYCTLTSDPSSFVGKHILVRAVYRYGFEIQRLDAPECCPIKKLKIWVEIGSLDGKSKRLFGKFPKGMGLVLATFSGIFETGGPFGDGGYRYKLTVDKIDLVEAVGHPSEAGQPPWSDRDCSLGALEHKSGLGLTGAEVQFNR